jgi:hypothetical protein
MNKNNLNIKKKGIPVGFRRKKNTSNLLESQISLAA